MREKPVIASVRLTPPEHVELTEVCEELHISKSSFLRYSLFNTLKEIRKGEINYG